MYINIYILRNSLKLFSFLVMFILKILSVILKMNNKHSEQNIILALIVIETSSIWRNVFRLFSFLKGRSRTAASLLRGLKLYTL